MKLSRLFRDERGVALPMALITLVLLTTLMLAFSVLAQTEPVIAANQLRVSQARAMAESGMEHAIWALSAGNVVPGGTVPTGALANPMPASPPAGTPFDGATYTAFGGIGGYTVQVTAPDPIAQPLLRRIVADGWTPTNSVTDTRTKAHRRIQADYEALPDLATDAPCALCVRGDVQVSGSSLVDARTDTNCGGTPKFGAYAAGTLERQGSSNIKGQAGTTSGGNVEGVDFVDGNSASNPVDPATFDEFMFSNKNLDVLKELAKKNGTYFGPGFSGSTDSNGKAVTGTYSGSVSFNSGNKVKDGIVFIDTVNGQNITDSTSESSFANVSINGNPFISSEFAGMLVVNGRLSISGNMKIGGLVYVLDDLTYNGTGTGYIDGLVISQNVRNSTATAISDTDTTTGGNSRIKLNCDKARGAGQAPRTFSLVTGTYREIAGQ
jgi:hypothetical protein